MTPLSHPNLVRLLGTRSLLYTVSISSITQLHVASSYHYEDFDDDDDIDNNAAGVVVTDEVLQLPTQFAPPQQQALSAGGEGGVPQVLMLTEFCAKGNLADYLRSRGRAVIQPSHQLTYAM